MVSTQKSPLFGIGLGYGEAVAQKAKADFDPTKATRQNEPSGKHADYENTE